MAALHFTAMVAQPFLAKKAVENGKRYNELMDAHLKAGTVAFFALSLDALGITFLNEEIYFHIIFPMPLCSIIC